MASIQELDQNEICGMVPTPPVAIYNIVDCPSILEGRYITLDIDQPSSGLIFFEVFPFFV